MGNISVSSFLIIQGIVCKMVLFYSQWFGGKLNVLKGCLQSSLSDREYYLYFCVIGSDFYAFLSLAIKEIAILLVLSNVFLCPVRGYILFSIQVLTLHLDLALSDSK